MSRRRLRSVSESTNAEVTVTKGAVPVPPPLAGSDPELDWPPRSYALLSALVPGVGQAVQGRWVAAIAQFATVLTYLAGVWTVGRTEGVWLALAWNVWSAVDAYRHDPE